MTTQAEDLAKALDAHATAVVAASIHIHTGLSQIAEALGGRNARQWHEDGPGTPRMPGRVSVAAEPLRGAQGATQPGWYRVGRHYPIHVYEDDIPVATFHDPDTAARFVQAANNPAAPAPEWLDADTLDDLPGLTVAIRRDGTEPRWRDETGEWCLLGHNALHGMTSDELAPARVLWTPEADR